MATNYHVYVGAETGLLKGINVENKKWENLNAISEVSRSNEVCVMCWENQSQTSILLGTRGGVVKSYSCATGMTQEILQVTDSNEQVLKGLYQYDNKYVTCTNKGKIAVWDENMPNNDNYGEESTQVTLDCDEDVYIMREDPYSVNRLATGGKENDLKMFDLNRPDAGAIFKAKNVRNDWLDLRVPVWVTDCGFIKRPGTSLLATCTGYHQIRLYDPSSSQRRPVVDILWGENPLTCMTICNHNDRQIMVGNSIGEQALIDLRVNRCVCKYKGGTGSIRSIQAHPSQAVAASCGLDRYVRVHDLNSRVLLHKFYLKSRLNKLLLVDNWDSEMKDADVEIKTEVGLFNRGHADSQEASDNDDDELWESLDTVKEDKKAVKRKQNGCQTVPTKAMNGKLKAMKRQAKNSE